MNHNHLYTVTVSEKRESRDFFLPMIPESIPPRLTLPPLCRMRSGADYQRVYARKCSLSVGYLSLAAAPNELNLARLGLSVSRRVGCAVKRNRWKRLLREAFRLTRLQWPSGIDYVAIPRAAEPPLLAQLQAELLQLAIQLQRRLQQRRPSGQEFKKRNGKT